MTQLAVQQEAAQAFVHEEYATFFKDVSWDDVSFSGDADDRVAVVGGEEYPVVDMVFAIKIIQPGHAQVDKKLSKLKGKILLQLGDEPSPEDALEEMNLIPLAPIRHGMRNYGAFKDGADSDNALVCYSTNGFTPSDKVVSPQNHVCAEAVCRGGRAFRNVVCPAAQWVDGKKPACGESITIAFFDLDRKIPVTMEMHGTAISAWRKLAKSYRQQKNVAKLKRKSIGDYYVKLTLEDNGTYYVPVFKMVESTDKDEFGKVSQWKPLALYYLGTLCPEPKVEQYQQPQVASAADADVAIDVIPPTAGGSEEAQQFSI